MSAVTPDVAHWCLFPWLKAATDTPAPTSTPHFRYALQLVVRGLILSYQMQIDSVDQFMESICTFDSIWNANCNHMSKKRLHLFQLTAFQRDIEWYAMSNNNRFDITTFVFMGRSLTEHKKHLNGLFIYDYLFWFKLYFEYYYDDDCTSCMWKLNDSELQKSLSPITYLLLHIKHNAADKKYNRKTAIEYYASSWAQYI